jgi:formylglycine-generating enzyme required for sulfatase activity
VSHDRPLNTNDLSPCRAFPFVLRRAGIATGAALFVTAAWLAGCRETSSSMTPEQHDPGAAKSSLTTGVAALRPRATAAVPRLDDAGAPPLLTVGELERAAPSDACPATMVYIRGGEFSMGSPRGRGARDERPRFSTRVADFCLDTYEVTSASYEHCVRSGSCAPPRGAQETCNYGRREDHPINCVDWAQADTYCKSHGARLPSELEWEYAARGGAEYRPFAWGHDSADDRACWKRNQSCPVGSYAPGAFGLHDMSGNVWEWTHDWFGDYPWPPLSGRSKVFRGGGWSHRDDKWFGTTLRNRTSPERSGSFLGFRCARLAKDAECPFGAGDEPGVCRQGVMDVECASEDQQWNGLRCAERGAPECGPDQDAVSGHGCVRRASEPPLGDADGELPDERLDRPEPPARTRTPEHDDACRLEQPRRPSAYVIRGGTDSGRRRYARALSCRNRGVGWRAVCCRE